MIALIKRTQRIKRYCIGTYETHEAYVQAYMEGKRLDAIEYLRREGGEATIGRIARAIGESHKIAALIVDNNSRSFRRRRYHDKNGAPSMTVELHPHLMAVA